MELTSFNINLTSEHPEHLVTFYGDVLGLKREPEEEGGGFRIASDEGLLMRLFVDGHSEVRGPAKEPARVLINFGVRDARAEREALEAKGVRFIRKEGVEFWGGIISTFLDPDGNYCQLVQMPSA